MSILTTSIHHCLEVLFSEIRKKKIIYIEREEVKLALFSEYLVNFIKNPIGPTKTY